MMNLRVKRQRSERDGGLSQMFASRPAHDRFSSFYGDLSRRCDHGCVDELASAHMLYLFLGELRNRR